MENVDIMIDVHVSRPSKNLKNAQFEICLLSLLLFPNFATP
jgi:hypothetical protein